jgi:hypothetical protein
MVFKRRVYWHHLGLLYYSIYNKSSLFLIPDISKKTRRFARQTQNTNSVGKYQMSFISHKLSCQKQQHQAINLLVNRSSPYLYLFTFSGGYLVAYSISLLSNHFIDVKRNIFLSSVVLLLKKKRKELLKSIDNFLGFSTNQNILSSI